jgi:hypothetical protein
MADSTTFWIRKRKASDPIAFNFEENWAAEQEVGRFE